MKRPPHPTLDFSDLWPAAASSRLSCLPGIGELQFFFNGRAALHHLFGQLRRDGRKRVLLPAFHCVSVVEPAIRAGMEVSFYRVDRRLGIDFDEVMSLLRSDVAAVVFINYFGFPAAFEPLLDALRARAIAVVEDCSHSFLFGGPLGLAGQRADFSVYSFWKLVASGVGGALWSAATLPAPSLRMPPWRDSLARTKRLLEQAVLARDGRSRLARWYGRLEAARVRRRGAATGLSHAGPPSPADASAEFDPRQASTKLPCLPRHILRAADLQRIVAARRANHLVYARSLEAASTPRSVLPELPARVCPWAFPVLMPRRCEHDLKLRERGIPVWTFGDVLHPALDRAASDRAISDARFLAATLLCLPLHQGISTDDAGQFAAILLDYVGVNFDHAD